MGKLTVSINGEHVIAWNSDYISEIDGFKQRLFRNARKVRQDELVQLAVIRMAEGNPIFGNSLTDRLCCICFAMEQPTINPDFPSRLRDHLPFHDIDVDVTFDVLTKIVYTTARNRITLH